VGPGADTQADGAPPERWTPPIRRCVATRGEGITELVESLELHRRWVHETETGRARRRGRVAEEMRESLREALIDAAVHALGGAIDEAVRAVDARESDPYSATEGLVATFRAK
jgi:LAO/AO transport system kinase